MRVAINGWFWSRPDTGSGQYVRRLVYELSQHNTDKLLLILPHPVPRVPPQVRTKVVTAAGNQLGKVFWEQTVVPQAANQWSAEVLHIPYWAPPLISAIPVVVTIHDLIPLLLPAYRGGNKGRLYTFLVQRATLRAAQTITDSYAARGDILKHLHIPPEKVHSIWLAADKQYHPGSEPRDKPRRRRLGLDSGYVLYLGGFDVRKNLSVLLKAFAKVRRAVPQAHLAIAGKLPTQHTAFTPDPRQLAREAMVPDEALTFTGFVPETAKAALYRGAQVFAFPSRYEGFGLPPLEAITCGTPVVGSNASSLPEVVGEAGRLFAPDDIAGMSGAFIQLLTDAKLQRRLSHKAHQQAAQFSWVETVKQTYKVYQQA